MDQHLQWPKIAISCAALLFLGVGHQRTEALPVTVTAQSQKTVCTAPEYRQFDFWIGDWDVFDVGKPDVKSAHVRVTSILGGCVLHEEYEDPTGAKGESFSIYDATRKVWHQTWVTNHGRLLMIEGRFDDGKMTMEGNDLTTDGKPRRVRGVWKAVSGGVQETAVTSLDGGKTWQPWFDLVFRSATEHSH